MQLRRFTADTTPAALGAVRMALGDDAIILANRRVGDQVEIIATAQMDDMSALAESSTDEVTASMAARPAESPQMYADGSMAAFGPSSPVRIDADAEPDHNRGRAAEKPVRYSDIKDYGDTSDMADDKVSLSGPGSAAHGSSNGSSPLLGERNAAVLRPRDSGQNSANSGAYGGKPAAQAGQRTAVAPTLESLAAAMTAQSQVLDQHFRSLEVNLWGVNAPNRSLHLQQLLSLGIGAELAVRLVERCAAELPADTAIRQSLATLKSSLNIARDKSFDVPGVTIMYGPPGAGKTTALMKLATEHVRQHDNQSIVIICADTRRIGAFEELQAYGRLLGVPTVHAHDMAELTSLATAFQHKKLVLIDHTLPEDERSVPLPRSLLSPSNLDTVRHLFALPATAQASTADALIRKHCSHKQQMHLVLTNLDTSARFGELLNAIIRHETPVAYWSDDASVQRPLERADASVLIATAVAMRKRIDQSTDDQWLQRLIQPSNQVFPTPTEAAEGSVQNCA